HEGTPSIGALPMPKTLWSAMRVGEVKHAGRKWAKPPFPYTEAWRAGCPVRRQGREIRNGRNPHKALSRAGCRRDAAGRAVASLSAQPGVWSAAGGGGDLRMVALPYKSQMDLSARLVASMSRLKGAGFGPYISPGNPETALAPEGNVPSNEPLAVLLLGPTGSGKTALSLALGERFDGEIVSCDSVAGYRGMDLGTAKPSAEERTRLPHHLIDVTEPDQPFTAGAYSRAARAALADIAGRGKLPIVTGGTGLYLRALTDGLFAGPERQEGLRERLRLSGEKHGDAWLHRLLTRLD